MYAFVTTTYLVRERLHLWHTSENISCFSGSQGEYTTQPDDDRPKHINFDTKS